MRYSLRTRELVSKRFTGTGKKNERRRMLMKRQRKRRNNS